MDGKGSHPQITIVTGQRKSGRTTYAVLVGSDLSRRGYTFYHNGTALIGYVYSENYLKNPEGYCI